MANKAVVTLAGGKYLAGAAVQLMELRHLGCDWDYHLLTVPGDEVPDSYRVLFASMGVQIREVSDYLGHPWTAKCSAIRELIDTDVLFLDSDCIPLVNPEVLRLDPRYQKAGSIFWRDFGVIRRDNILHGLLGVAPFEDFETESGQILINTRRCRAGLDAMREINLRWEEIYAKVHGDKDTWHFAWKKAGLTWEWGSSNIGIILDDHGHGRAIIQKWGDQPVFHHRCHAKFSVTGDVWHQAGLPLRWLEHLEAVKSRVR